MLNHKNFPSVQIPPLIFFIFLLLTACSSAPTDKYPSKKGSWQEFSGRDWAEIRNEDALLMRPVVYRAFVPFQWERKDADTQKSIKDTMKPICEYTIHDSNMKIRLTIHTFPFNDSSSRIPCMAQITRWKDQFQEIDLLFTFTTQESHGGFCGLKLEAQGIYQNEKCKILAWSMQLAQEHERRLTDQGLDKYKLADYTIKVMGSPFLVEKHKKEIQNFANSFEFIEELQTTL